MYTPRFPKKKPQKGWEPARDGGRGERAELRSVELPFLRTCLAASSSYPTDYEQLCSLSVFLHLSLLSLLSLSWTRRYNNHDNADCYYNRLGLESRNYVRRTYFLDDHHHQRASLHQLPRHHDLHPIFFLRMTLLECHKYFKRNRCTNRYKCLS